MSELSFTQPESRVDDFFQRQAESNDDPFVRDLFTELDKRIEEYEKDAFAVDRIKLSDAAIPCFIAMLIVFLAFITILQHQ